MIEIFAIRPSGLATAIHLYSPGYQPGKKPRHPAEVPLCNGAASVRQRDLVPLTDALTWTQPHQPCEHCDAHRPDWHWCHVCLGHGIKLTGFAEQMVGAIAHRLARQAEP